LLRNKNRHIFLFSIFFGTLFIPITAKTHLLLRNMYTPNRSDLHHVRIFSWRRFDETDIPPSKFELKTYELDILV